MDAVVIQSKAKNLIAIRVLQEPFQPSDGFAQAVLRLG
jgi:hypothetical protein